MTKQHVSSLIVSSMRSLTYPHLFLKLPINIMDLLWVHICLYIYIYMKPTGVYHEVFDNEASANIPLQNGVALFYEVLSYLRMETRQYPPSNQFLTSCISILGQVWWGHVIVFACDITIKPCECYVTLSYDRSDEVMWVSCDIALRSCKCKGPVRCGQVSIMWHCNDVMWVLCVIDLGQIQWDHVSVFWHYNVSAIVLG